MNYDTDEFTNEFNKFISSMSDEEFESFMKDVDKCTKMYSEGTMIERLIRDGNWWDSLMDVYYKDDNG